MKTNLRLVNKHCCIKRLLLNKNISSNSKNSIHVFNYCYSENISRTPRAKKDFPSISEKVAKWKFSDFFSFDHIYISIFDHIFHIFPINFRRSRQFLICPEKFLLYPLKYTTGIQTTQHPNPLLHSCKRKMFFINEF
jgi:hypothetical protein